MRKYFLLLAIIVQSIFVLSQELIEVGSWEYGPSEAMAVNGSTAYISSGSYLWVLDISDESNISLVDEIKLDSYINFIRRIGNYLYISKNDSILNIYDIHNASNPTLAGDVVQPFSTPLTDISVKADTLFLMRNNELGREYYLNDSINLQHIRYIDAGLSFKQSGNKGIGIILYLVKSYDMSQSGDIYVENDLVGFGETVRGIAINGNFVYVGAGSNGIGITDFSDVDNLIKIGTVLTGGITYDVELIEDTLLIAGKGTKGIGIYDIENDTLLTQIGECDTDGFVYEIEVIGNKVYAGARSGGLIIIDISDKTNPVVLGEYKGHGEIRGIDIHNDRLYAAGADGGLSIFDISGGSSMNLISQTYTRYISEDVSVDDSFAYIAEGDSGLTILDITDENNPSIISHLNIPYYARQVDNYENTCVVGGKKDNEELGIIVADISNRYNPSISDTVMANRSRIRFEIDNGYLHCVGERMYRHYEIWDVSDPNNVMFNDSIFSLAQNFEYVIARGGLSFLSINSKDTVICFDINNPDSISINSYIKTRSYGILLDLYNNYLIESTRAIIYVYDYTDPKNPIAVDTYDYGYYGEDMKNDGQYIYMSTGGGVEGSNLDGGRFGARIFTVGIPGVDENRKHIYQDISVITTFNAIQIQNNTNTTQSYQITDITGRVIDNITAKQGLNTYTPKRSGIYFIISRNNETLGKAIIVK